MICMIDSILSEMSEQGVLLSKNGTTSDKEEKKRQKNLKRQTFMSRTRLGWTEACV